MSAASPSSFDELAKSLPPKFTGAHHKGQHGRVCVIGGSYEYTGAPYYASMGSLKSGSDLCIIICAKEAGVPLKSYSPEFIVYPYIRSSRDGDSEVSDKEVQQLEDDLGSVLDRMHTVIVGPGLGRDEVSLKLTYHLLRLAQSKEKQLVIDADGLWLINQHIDVIRGYPKAILTPNAMELKRLCDAIAEVDQSEVPTDDFSGDEGRRQLIQWAAKRLDGPVILSKGKDDLICAAGEEVVSYGKDGSPRRCGGQGDVLSGILASFVAWAEQSDSPTKHALIAASLGACMATRKGAHIAFERNKRSMTTPDLIACIGEAMEELFPSGE